MCLAIFSYCSLLFHLTFHTRLRLTMHVKFIVRLLSCTPCQEGTFFLRNRAYLAGEYILSVIYKGKATHHLIEFVDNNFVVGKKKFGNASTLNEVIFFILLSSLILKALKSRFFRKRILVRNSGTFTVSSRIIVTLLIQSFNYSIIIFLITSVILLAIFARPTA